MHTILFNHAPAENVKARRVRRGALPGRLRALRWRFFELFGPAFSVLVWAFLTDWYQPGAPLNLFHSEKKAFRTAACNAEGLFVL